MKIGIFDSGIGGVTVLREIVKKYPKDQYVYFGDTANVPYGSKSPEKINELCKNACEILKNKNLDLLIIACNTASAHALNVFKEKLNLPVYGVVEPGVQAIVGSFNDLHYSKDRRILVLGTKSTIQSKIYSKEIRQRIILNEITEQACPLVVPLIEEGWANHPILFDVIQEYLRPYQSDPTPGIALLACTHYPWAEEFFKKALPQWTIVNSGKAIAEYIKREHLIRPTMDHIDSKNDNESGSKPKHPIHLDTDDFQIEWIFTDPFCFAHSLLDDFNTSLKSLIDSTL